MRSLPPMHTRMTAPDGILFKYFDKNMKNGWTVLIEEHVANWNIGTVHGPHWRQQAHKSLSGQTGPHAEKRSPLIGSIAMSETSNGGQPMVKIKVRHN